MFVKLSTGKEIPIEMHKIRIVQKTWWVLIEERLSAIKEAGYNTFLLKTSDIFLDMLTDSGTNAMSDNQLAATMVADDSYAGSVSFYKLTDAIKEVLGFNYVLPVHQGRAAEHLICKVLMKPDDIILTNYHFTTTRAHIEETGKGVCLEIYADEALNTRSTHPFKGNIDLKKLKKAIKDYGKEKISFVRMEATTNLLGGQPFSMENLMAVREVCSEYKIPLIIDGSLISENAYLIKQREMGYEDKSIEEIVREMVNLCDIFYLSGRKNTSVRGGFIATNNKEYYNMIKVWLPFYEGFLTYGGMSTKEIEAMAVGVREMTDPNVAGCSIEQIRYLAEKLIESGVPVLTPPGGLGCHLDAKLFLPHIPQNGYPAGSLAVALYIASGVRSMERGTISTDRDKSGGEVFADLELVRIAFPRRVYTLSHIEYIADRLSWLYNHRDLIGRLRFITEPPVLRFFFGKLEAVGNWDEKLGEVFKKEFGPLC